MDALRLLIFINSSRGAKKKKSVCVCTFVPDCSVLSHVSRHGHILLPADIKSFSIFFIFQILNLNILGI